MAPLGARVIPRIDTDVLVVGGGGAGVRAALSAAQEGARVVLALKGQLGRSGATTYRVSSVGGFQAATGLADADDSPDEHTADIVRAAQGMCSPRLARIVATEAPRVLDDLLARGVEVALVDGRPVISTGCFASRPRMYWLRGHGHSIVQALTPALAAAGVEVRERVLATTLLLAEGVCAGATLLGRDGDLLAVRAKATILCTGGAARLFAPSLVPPELTGDGYALALRAGAALANLEFVQLGFAVAHPVTYLLSPHLWHLVPTVRNGAGDEVLARSLPPGVSVDAVARARATHYPFSSRVPDRFLDVAIHRELVEGRATPHGGIALDFRGRCEAIDGLPSAVRLRWEYLRQTLVPHGVDPAETPLEVAIAGHAFNGGVLIDEWGHSTLQGLYAAGEAAAGPHGADRLGGNMLLTSQVFGERAGRAAAERARREPHATVAAPSLAAEAARVGALYRSGGAHGLRGWLDRLGRAMARVAIVRDEPSLAGCLGEIAEGEAALSSARIAEPGDVWRAIELQNLLLVGRLVTTAARLRRETRGSHYRADHPEPDETAWGRSIVLRQVGERLEHALASL